MLEKHGMELEFFNELLFLRELFSCTWSKAEYISHTASTPSNSIDTKWLKRLHPKMFTTTTGSAVGSQVFFTRSVMSMASRF